MSEEQKLNSAAGRGDIFLVPKGTPNLRQLAEGVSPATLNWERLHVVQPMAAVWKPKVALISFVDNDNDFHLRI